MSESSSGTSPGQPNVSFLEYAKTVGAEIDDALDRYTTYDEDCPEKLRAAIRHSLLAPGKRLRPLLVLMACEACGSDRGRAMPAACAVEMVHTYSLIHDDLPAMDDDPMRRGQPSCHVKFGEATAILAGDALLAQAFEVLAGGIDDEALAGRCCRELAKTAGASALVGGQCDDLDGIGDLGDLESLERIHRRKTGAMFVVSLRLGGMIGGATNEQMAALQTYSKKLGLAFQIIDDLLDIRGNSAELGKTSGKDQLQGKRTFPALLGIEESHGRAAELIAAARQSVRIFGESASNLDSLAAFVLERNR